MSHTSVQFFHMLQTSSQARDLLSAFQCFCHLTGFDHKVTLLTSQHNALPILDVLQGRSRALSSLLPEGLLQNLKLTQHLHCQTAHLLLILAKRLEDIISAETHIFADKC